MNNKVMKLILAPMATLSNEALRRAIARFGGCDEYYTEMIHCPSLVAGGQYEPFYLRTGPEPEKIVWQLTGSHLEDFASAAKIVSELGGIGIDINMGCSAPEIVKTGAGISWMKKPLAETAAMVRAVKNVLRDVPPEKSCHRLSVKFRLGAGDWTEKGFFDFIDMLLDEGVTQFVLHPRTQKEKLGRPPRLQYCEQLAEHIFSTRGKFSSDGFEYSVIVNGNIRDVESATQAMKKCPSCSGLMLARSAVQKPWLFSEIARADSMRDCIKIDLLEVAQNFIFDLSECQPKDFYLTRAHRFFTYYCDNFTFGNQLKNRILNTTDLDGMINHLAEYFEKMPDERFRGK